VVQLVEDVAGIARADGRKPLQAHREDQQRIE
jgi:hypothetical protein